MSVEQIVNVIKRKKLSQRDYHIAINAVKYYEENFDPNISRYQQALHPEGYDVNSGLTWDNTREGRWFWEAIHDAPLCDKYLRFKHLLNY